jgi:hypothetical protein
VWLRERLGGSLGAVRETSTLGPDARASTYVEQTGEVKYTAMSQANLLAAASTALHGKPLLKARPTPSELRTDVRTMLERDAGYSIASSGARRGAPVALQSFCPIWQTS